MRAHPNALVLEGFARGEAEITIKPNMVLIDIDGVFSAVVRGLGAIEFVPQRRSAVLVTSADDPR